jgi:hypothetical protein
MCDRIHTYISVYVHILCLTLTFSCQTTFISGSSEIMNCVCSFLDYIDCIIISVVVRVIQHRDTNLHLQCHELAGKKNKFFFFPNEHRDNDGNTGERDASVSF